jgi:hypothetical protein
LIGSLVQEKAQLTEQLSGTTAKAKGILEKSKGVVVKGLLAHYLVAGLAIGSMLLILYGGFIALSKSLDPAAAAGILGFSVVLMLVGGALFFTRPRRD